MQNSQSHITLIGAGLSGSLLAILLAKKGFKVEVFERRPDLRKVKLDAGRSINLALSERGIHALKIAGVEKQALEISIPMRGRMMHDVNSNLTYHAYGKDDSEYINSISRPGLNKILLDTAESLGVKIYFNQRCTGMDFQKMEVYFTDELTGKNFSNNAERVIGTDGSASAIRTEYFKTTQFNYSQQYQMHGYKELTIPSGSKSSFRMEKNALHIWPRKSYMLIALPNLDGSYTATLFLQMQGEKSFQVLADKNKVENFFRNEFPDAYVLIPELADEFFNNPTGILLTIKCNPWYIDDKALLLGDAAHAMVPFFGQGMNCAFEDCEIFNQCLDNFDGDWKSLFKNIENKRKIHTDAISDLAVENFFVMRDRVTDPRFLLEKELEHLLERKFPEHFIPLYSMVTFRRTPYAIAMKRGKIQETILQKLSEGIETVEELDLHQAKELIYKELDKLEENL